MNNKPVLINVVGPTAIGKTRLAIELAQHFKCEIVSADSRQFFKEMNIGTAVPSPEELKAATHHFIQHISIEDAYSVGDFERDGLALLQNLFTQQHKQILVGGSGLYVDAINKGLDYFPEVDTAIRSQLNLQLNEQGITILQDQLRSLDPVYFDKIDQNNPHRLIRALEICIGTGKPYSSFLNKQKPERNFQSVFVGLTAERALIYERINLRVDLMMEAGLLEEVKTVYPFKHLNALQTVGYRELFTHLDGNCTLVEAVEEIKKNTRRFAKRQLTWFRKNQQIHWFDYQTPTDEIVHCILNHIH